MPSCYKMNFLAGHGEGGCKTERGSKGPGPALTAGVSTHYSIFLLEREDLGTSLLLCPGKMFRKGNENVLSWLWG
jgi:hypothetical protein